MSKTLLAALNAFREAEGKAPFADWRNARHQPLLAAYQAAAEVTKAKAKQQKPKPVDPTEQPKKFDSYKVLARKAQAKSGVEKPVDFVHATLNAHPDMARKEAIALLVAYGVNFSTARTQYQKWFAAKKAKG